MKHLKNYNFIPYYCMIPSDNINYIKIAINKLNILDNIKKEIISIIITVNKNNKYKFLYIAMYNEIKWGYYTSNIKRTIFSYKGFKYIGEIIVEPWELEANKYNL